MQIFNLLLANFGEWIHQISVAENGTLFQSLAGIFGEPEMQWFLKIAFGKSGPFLEGFDLCLTLPSRPLVL